ncbi:ATP-dependent nuclease [Methanosarcina sp.]|uniref:ATP-dependent nuclease n=1 Tax=Methanosarcina sp. TaxID=2213 RepID=UPI002989338C|nr:AAA family ATPase [Methanosarcina sp.]MDW5549923.1 AAA family ATPase [Methanosarcina sp.]MDW5552527.1 AAA family ATPase [Methanosarcina sp.]MDW5560257.1 AAA family ATPase [Methanosarcina sp.]
MKIKSISIQNFKCHKKIQDIPFHSITTFVGENDSGKTSIIDFIELILDNKIPKEDDFFHDAEGNFETEIIGEITLIPNLKLQENILHLLNGNNELKIKKVLTLTNMEVFLEMKKYEDKRFHEFENLEANELSRLLRDYGIEEQRNQQLRKEKIREYLKNNYVQYSYDFVLVNWKEFSQFLPKIVRYGVNDYKNPTNMIFKTLYEKYRKMLYEYNETNGSTNLKNSELSIIAKNAETEINDEIIKLKSFIQKYNPDIESIYISPEFDFTKSLISVSIDIIDRKTKSPIVFENRGFGTQKRLFMGIFDWEASVIQKLGNTPIIRCYDEPDNSLHIDAQRKMYKAIKEISKSDENNQIVVCTHSLFMIDNMPTNTISLLKRNDDSTTSIETVEAGGEIETNEFMTSVCKEMGLSNSHLFFEKAFILVEGPSEINFLPLAYSKLYSSSFTEDGISLINLSGNGAATNFLKLLMKNKRDIIILLLDSDTKNLRKSELYKAYNPTTADTTEEKYKEWVDTFFSEKIILIGDKEFEDSFSDIFISKVLTKYRPKRNSLEWTSEEISLLRVKTKFSDEIIKAVSNYCSPNYITKPLLGRYFAEECIKDDVPEKINELFLKVRGIIGIEESKY